MRSIAVAAVVVALTGCASQSNQQAQQGGVVQQAGEGGQPALASVPLCNANAWQLDGMLWFDSSQPVDNQPRQRVFDSAGRECLMQFK